MKKDQNVQNKKRGSWLILFCPICNTYQRPAASCKICDNRNLVEKKVDSAKYCALLAEHTWRIVGEKIIAQSESIVFRLFTLGFEKGMYRSVDVYRCARCGAKRVGDPITSSIYPKDDSPRSWGEKP